MCKKSEMQFSVFLIHQLAHNWGKTPQEVYHTLDKTRILDDYIIKHYDVLHTMGEQSLVEDITNFVKEKQAV
ncbi:DUF3791 domain-containing protein [uncultured Treponema sp.]|uniref:DUF3791 domain-containing protein n=1 Tax=uncultured Treponema sp. TaxID=162155 RepID=UPI0025E3257B|nr:DUF3791 domain-containing protein [uncultured Treponema sp.]MBQ7538118.1 DUF3791 domain-containing protein [Treponema sp.]